MPGDGTKVTGLTSPPYFPWRSVPDVWARPPWDLEHLRTGGASEERASPCGHWVGWWGGAQKTGEGHRVRQEVQDPAQRWLFKKRGLVFLGRCRLENKTHHKGTPFICSSVSHTQTPSF